MLALCKNKPTRTLLQILSFPSTGPLVILTLISPVLFSDLLFYYCLPVDLVALKHFQSNILWFCSRSAFVTVAPLMSFYSRFLRSCFLLVHDFVVSQTLLHLCHFLLVPFWTPTELPFRTRTEIVFAGNSSVTDPFILSTSSYWISTFVKYQERKEILPSALGTVGRLLEAVCAKFCRNPGQEALSASP